jgi:hypothetical protein
MKKIAVVILFQAVYWTGFSENPLWKNADETLIPAHADVDVRWETANVFVSSNVPTNKWPSEMWIYQLAPRKFSPKVVSNLMFMCSFTKKDKVQQDTNGMTFKSSDGLRSLFISFSSGSISYNIPEPHFSPVNLAEGVPKNGEMPKLTKGFLQKMEIKLSEIQKNTNDTPRFNFWEPLTVYYPRGYPKRGVSITNIAFRAVNFRRSVNGAEVIGNAGYCELQFGEHGKISKIDFSWPDLKRYKSAPTLKPDAITRLLREGKARQGATFDNVGYIDWPSVKSVTIKQAWPCYFAGDSNFLYPFLALWTTVDTGHGNVDVGIDCPIIDESKN